MRDEVGRNGQNLLVVLLARGQPVTCTQTHEADEEDTGVYRSAMLRAWHLTKSLTKFF